MGAGLRMNASGRPAQTARASTITIKGTHMKIRIIAASLCATLTVSLPALANNTAPAPTAPKQNMPGPAIQPPALPSVIKDIKYAYAGSNLMITVLGNNGDGSCGLLIQRYPLSGWDPVQGGQQGVVVVVGKAQRQQLPVTVGYGKGIAPKETVSFSAKGLATAGMPACAGAAESSFSFAPPPPPDVNS